MIRSNYTFLNAKSSKVDYYQNESILIHLKNSGFWAVLKANEMNFKVNRDDLIGFRIETLIYKPHQQWIFGFTLDGLHLIIKNESILMRLKTILDF